MSRKSELEEKIALKEVEKEEQNRIRELEQFYTTGKVDTILENIEKKKKELVEEMVKYAKDKEKACRWSRDGDEVDWKVDLSPIVIENKFFKSITPLGSKEPEYNAEKLSLAYDFYLDILAEVNDKIGHYPVSLTSFCHFAGITLATLRQYRNSTDLDMRTIVEKIYDQTSDVNVTMSQLGIVRERSTIFRLKSQNEVVEKEQPKISINIVEKPDMERIQSNIEKYKEFAEKKGRRK